MPAPHPDPPAAGADDGPPAFGGDDPGQALAATLCKSTPTKCQARTRLYRNGVLELEGFPVADISEYLADQSAVVWLDLRDPDRADLEVLSAEFGLHPVAIEDAVVSTSARSWTATTATCSSRPTGSAWIVPAASWPPASWRPSSPGAR